MQLRNAMHGMLESLAHGHWQLLPWDQHIAIADKLVRPPPPITWVLFGLVAYRERLRWLAHTFLPSLTDEFSALDARTDAVRFGVVPGHESWRFQIDRDISIFTHSRTEECVFLPSGGNAELIADFGFQSRVFESTEPVPHENHLRELFPDGLGLLAALDALAAARLLNRDHCWCSQITKDVDVHRDTIFQVLADWSALPSRLPLAIAIGDWNAARQAAELTGRNELVEPISARQKSGINRGSAIEKRHY
ncbi:MAG: hypothetical protein AB7I37_12260 [Pirellulales bacterium]